MVESMSKLASLNAAIVGRGKRFRDRGDHTIAAQNADCFAPLAVFGIYLADNCGDRFAWELLTAHLNVVCLDHILSTATQINCANDGHANNSLLSDIADKRHDLGTAVAGLPHGVA